MKKKLRYMVYDKEVEREINYIPVRFIIAVVLALLATLAVMAIVVLLSLYPGVTRFSCTSVRHILS